MVVRACREITEACCRPGHGPHRSHAETDLLGIMIIQPGHQVVLAQETARTPAIQAVRKNARPVPFIYVIINLLLSAKTF